MDPKNFKATKLRGQTIEQLEGALNDLRSELATLRVNQVSSGVAAKLAKIRVI
jgi:ribosomal protein L29